MENKTKEFIIESVNRLIENTTDNKKINKLVEIHGEKIHFIPIRYRVFSGLLQSMNIQFGNFIEKLLHIIVENENNLSIHSDISGKRNIKLSITRKTEVLIDAYITGCQTNSFSDNSLQTNFNNLINKCLKIEEETAEKEINIKHDIDILFSKNEKNFYYLEVKYNDDHDTGKYADINRKFIKSYLGIANILKIYNQTAFKPILYYMTKKKLKGNIYLPETENIYRGDRLFKEFFSIKYETLDEQLRNISDDASVISLFDNLYNQIRNMIKIK